MKTQLPASIRSVCDAKSLLPVSKKVAREKKKMGFWPGGWGSDQYNFGGLPKILSERVSTLCFF